MEATEKIKMEPGKIYFIDYGGTQIVGKFKEEDITQYYFYDYLHYWNRFEQFHKNTPYCVHSGITEIREASKAEKFHLTKFEIEHDCI